VALYIEDTQFVDGCMNKKPCKVGRFASTLRLRLFREFLGEISCSSSGHEPDFSSLFPANTTSLDRKVVLNNYQPHLDLTDPCSDEFYKKVLLKYAAQNTKIYDTVFKCIPCDYVSNFEELKAYNKTPGLNSTDTSKARAELNKIKGFIVLYPNRFLSRQDLTPPLGTKEKLLPTRLWT
jgi:phospholipase D1/2